MLAANGEKANGERNRSHVPRSSSAMSLGSAIPWRVALQQSPPPLYRPESMLNPPAETVRYHWLEAGEFSTGVDKTDRPPNGVGGASSWEMSRRARFLHSRGLLSWMWLLSSSTNRALRHVWLV